MRKLLFLLLFVSAGVLSALEIPLQEWKEFDQYNPRPDTVVMVEGGVMITTVKGYSMMYCSLAIPMQGDLRISFCGSEDNAADALCSAQLRSALDQKPLVFASSPIRKDGTLVLPIPQELRGKNAYLLLLFNQSAGNLLKMQIGTVDFVIPKVLAVLDDFSAPAMGAWKEFDAANPLPDSVIATPDGLRLTMQKRAYAVIYREVTLPVGTNALSVNWQGIAVPDAKVQFVLRSKDGKTLDDVTMSPTGKAQCVRLKCPLDGPAVVLVFLHRPSAAYTLTLRRMEAIQNSDKHHFNSIR